MLSSSEINSLKGMRSGGMPYSEIIQKMEVTDLGAYEDEDGIYHDPRESYEQYMRAEIIDRTPDMPSMDDDSFSRNPTRSRKIIGLHYGTPNESPAHPEMFMGFTDPDPRGASTDPRFDKFREHTAARAKVQVLQMGENSDMQVGQRPWTGPAIEAGRMETFKLAKNRRIKVFSPQIQNDRPKGQTVSAIAQLARKHVETMLGRGDKADEEEAQRSGGTALGDVVASRKNHMYEAMVDTGHTQLPRDAGYVNGVPNYFMSKTDHFVDSVADQSTRTNMAIVMKNALDARRNVANDGVMGEGFAGEGVPTSSASPQDVMKIYLMSRGDMAGGESLQTSQKSHPYLAGAAPEQEHNQTLDNSRLTAISGHLIESSAGSKRAAQWLADFMTVLHTGAENQAGKGYAVYGDPTPVGKVEAAVVDHGRTTKVYGARVPDWGAPNGATSGKHEQKFQAGKRNSLYRQNITNWRSHTENSDPKFVERDFGRDMVYSSKGVGKIADRPRRPTADNLSEPM